MPKVAYTDHELFIDIAKETGDHIRDGVTVYKLARELKDADMCECQLHKLYNDIHTACVVSKYFAAQATQRSRRGK